MKKQLLLFACLLGLFACGNQQKKCVIVQEDNDTQQEIAHKIPHIFHGMTKSITVGTPANDGSFVNWLEPKPCTVKYALYMENGIIAIFDDNNQLYHIKEYIGKEVENGATCYPIATYDQNREQGYVEFIYCEDGRTLLMIDYPKYAMSYSLDTFMPQAEFEAHLKRYKK